MASFIAHDQQSLTRYGWLMATLEESGAGFGTQFIMGLQASRDNLPYLYQTLMMESPPSLFRFWHQAAVTTPVGWP